MNTNKLNSLITATKVIEKRSDLLVGASKCKVVNVMVSRDNDMVYKQDTSITIQLSYDNLTKEANQDMLYSGPSKIGVFNGKGSKRINTYEKVLANVIRITMSDDLAEELEVRGLTIMYNFKTDTILVPFENQLGRSWINAKTNKVVSDVTKNFESFKFLCTSTSEEKNGITTWVKTTNDDTAFKVINKVAPGFIDNLPCMMSKRTANTVAARVGLIKFGGKDYKLGSVGYFSGQFDKTGNNAADGVVWMSYSEAKSIFGVAGRALRNLVIQPRIFGVYKMQVIVVPDSTYRAMCDELAGRGNAPATVSKDSPLFKTYGSYTNIFADKAPVTKYPDILVDVNAKKADIDLNEIILTVKALGESSKGKYINKQIIQKILFESALMGKDIFNSTMEYFKAQGVITIREALDATLDESFAPVLTDSDYNITSSLIRDPRVIDGKIRNAYVGFAKMINKLHIREDNIFNGVVTCDISCIFGLQVLDKNEIVFGRKSNKMTKLRKDKANDLEAFNTFMDTYRTCLIFKYPSMGLKEYATMTVLGTDEVCDKIDAVTADNRIKAALKDYYINIADSSVVFAAFEETYKLLAGMDNDFDHCQIIFNKFYLTILGGKEQLINVSPSRISEAAPVRPKNVKDTSGEDISTLAKTYGITEAEYNLMFGQSRHAKSDDIVLKEPNGKYNHGFFYHSYIVYRKMSGSVGLITLANDKISAMAAMAALGDFTAVDKFLAELFGNTTAEVDVFSVNTDVVDPNCADRVVYAMGRCKWTNENKIAFLLVCSELFRMYQEGCIDATKTGIFIACVVTNDTVAMRSLLKVKYNYEKGNVEFADFKSRKHKVTHVDGTKEEIMSDLFEDYMGELMLYLVDKANAFVSIFREQHKDMLVHTTEEQAVFSNTLTAVSKGRTSAKALADLRVLKELHKSIGDAYRESIKAIPTKISSEEREAMIESYKDERNDSLEILSSLVKQSLNKKFVKEGNVKFLGRLLDAVSNTTRYNNYQKYAGTFGAETFKEALIAANVGEEYKLVGTVLQGKNVLCDLFNAEGDVVTVSFKDGVNDEHANLIVLKERFTGDVMFDGETVYIIKSVNQIEDEVKAKAIIIDSIKANILCTKVLTKSLADVITNNSVIQPAAKSVYFWVDRVNKPDEYLEIPGIAEFSNLTVGVDYYINSVSTIITQFNNNGINQGAFYDDKESFYLIVEQA